MFEELYNWLLQTMLKGKRLWLIAQDNGKDARYGHKTPSKKEQIARKEAKKEYAFGYKLQVAADAELEVPLVTEIASANKHDKTFSTEFMAE